MDTVQTQSSFCQSRSIFIPAFGLDFSCLLRFSVLVSWQTAQYKQQEQICVVVSNSLFGQHSINVALHPHSCKKLPVCPPKVTPNLPSGQWSWGIVIAEMDRKRHIELAPHLILTMQRTCRESMALITALLYRIESIGRIKNWSCSTAKKHCLFSSSKVAAPHPC